MTYQSSLETRCRTLTTALCIAGLIGASGCELAYEDALVNGEAWEVTGSNGLPRNGLPDNGLPDNGLPDNGLPDNGLPDNGLPDNGLASSAIDQDWEAWLNDSERGTLNALLMSYLVRCALSSSQSASYTDSASNTWEWNGEIGVATGWASGALSAAEERWVTSCVLSLVNGNGSSITISQRGTTSSVYTVDETELEVWDLKEGAFFGNMFASTPEYYACHATGMSDELSGRVCTGLDEFGNPNCAPIQPLGSCNTVCSKQQRSYGGENYDAYYDCDDGSTVWAEVTSTALDL